MGRASDGPPGRVGPARHRPVGGPGEVAHLTGPAIDRLDHLRHDPALAFPPGTRSIVVWNDRGLIRDGAVVTEPVRDADRSDVALLGAHQGVRYVARAVRTEAEARKLERATGGRFEHLRAAVATLPDWSASLLGYGAALQAWHARTRFCGACGAPTVATHAGHQRRCSDESCGVVQFPRADPAIITLIRRGDRCLLIHQPEWPTGRFSTLAGFVEPGETLEQAVAREIAEEVGLDIASTEYFASQPWPFPHTLMIGFRTVAAPGPVDLGDEVTEARWFTRAELRGAIDEGAVTIAGPFALSRTLIDDWLGGAGPAA